MCPQAPRASPCPSQHPCAGGSSGNGLQSLNPTPSRSQPACPRAGSNPKNRHKTPRCPAAAGAGTAENKSLIPLPQKRGNWRWRKRGKAGSARPIPAFPTLEGIRAPRFSLQQPPAALGWPKSAVLPGWSCRGIHQEYLEASWNHPGRGAAPRTCFY